eukprot:338418-Alexandrium_andersonii.AAC.2
MYDASHLVFWSAQPSTWSCNVRCIAEATAPSRETLNGFVPHTAQARLAPSAFFLILPRSGFHCPRSCAEPQSIRGACALLRSRRPDATSRPRGPT